MNDVIVWSIQNIDTSFWVIVSVVEYSVCYDGETKLQNPEWQ